MDIWTLYPLTMVYKESWMQWKFCDNVVSDCETNEQSAITIENQALITLLGTGSRGILCCFAEIGEYWLISFQKQY